MVPLKLTLRNFTGVRAGLNRDELVLDLEHQLGDARLVAIVGANGSGKTTVLDSLHPFLVMPFRAGGYSPGSFSFYDNIGDGDALKILEWRHSGATYRTSLTFRKTAKTQKTEAYLHIRTNGEWTVFTAPDGVISDGKVATYNACVESILGSPEMYFTSAFSAQGRKSLSAYGNGEIKSLMSELLGLDKVLELGGKAGDVTKGLRAHFTAMGADRQRVAESEAAVAAAEQSLQDHTAALAANKTKRQTARTDVQKATRELAEIQASQNANSATEIRRQSLTHSIKTAETGRRQQLAAVDGDASAASQQSTNERVAHDNDIRRLRAQIESHNTAARNQQTILSRRAEIEAAPAQVTALEAEEAGITAEMTEARASAQTVSALTAQIAGMSEKLKGIAVAGKDGAGLLERMTKRSALVGAVPCVGTDLQPRCELLKDAMEAKAALPNQQQRVSTLREEYAALAIERDALQAQLTAYGPLDQRIRELDLAVASVRNRLQTARASASLIEPLAHAQELIKHTQEQVAEIERSIAEKDAAHVEATKAYAARTRELALRRNEIHTATHTAIEGIRVELATLPPPFDVSTVAAAEQAVETADNALAAVEREIEAANAAIATAGGQITALKRQMGDTQSVKAKAAMLEQEIAHWTTLSRALSNDGIVALSIDDAGPTLAALTNDLLMSCYGPRYSVRIDTQSQAQNGNMKETFDVVVFDAERDDEKSVRMTSGGERIWINEALARAIALYQAQTSGRHYECLFADESDGALDGEHKRRFMAMKRRVLELGGYEREIFISHTPELWEMADAVINMEEYKLP